MRIREETKERKGSGCSTGMPRLLSHSGTLDCLWWWVVVVGGGGDEGTPNQTRRIFRRDELGVKG
jgi:hypothetical protein